MEAGSEPSDGAAAAKSAENDPPRRKGNGKPAIRGRLERLSERTIQGWLFDPSRGDERLSVEILVNGRVVDTVVADAFRSDLKRAEIGDGAHAFFATLPKSEFDGEVKSLAAREAKSKVELHCTIPPTRLISMLGADAVGATTGLVDGLLVGYVFDRDRPGVPLEIVVKHGGVVVGRTLANGPLPRAAEAAKAPPGCGFALDLGEEDVVHLAAGTFAVVARPDNFDLTPSVAILPGLATLEILDDKDGVARAAITIAPSVGVPLSFDVLLDDEPIAKANWRPDRPQRILPLYLDRVKGSRNRLSVRFAGTDLHIARSPQSLWAGIDRDLVANGQFEIWDGDLPRHWSVDVPATCRAFKTHTPLWPMRKALLGHEAIRLQALQPGDTILGASISQRLDVEELARHRMINVVLAAKADVAMDVVVSLALPAVTDAEADPKAEAATELVEVIARIEPAMSLRTLTLALPPGQRTGEAILSVHGGAGSARSIDIVLLALGPPGFAVTPPSAGSEPTVQESQQTNAVENGDFLVWSTPFVTRAASRRFEIADRWTVTSKQVCPSVDLRLTSLTTRDVGTGQLGAPGYGLALSGSIEGPYLRVQAQLDPFQLAEIGPLDLHAYVVAANPTQTTPQTRQARVNRIDEIFVIERHLDRGIDKEDIVVDHKLFSVARNVPVTRTGAYFRIQLPDRDVAALRERARAILYDPYVSLTLAFEWRETVDCTLADVAIGPRAAKAKPGGQGFFGIEDRNITAQLPLLKGLESWRTGVALAPPPALRTRSDAIARWTWPKEARSVDVVIPVFNAIDDTIACLRSLELNTAMPHRIVVVDDASEQSAAEQLDRFAAGRPWVQVIHNETNKGYTRSSNIGMAASGSEWVVLLNSDTIVTPGWLEGLFEAADDRPEAAMIGPVSNAASWQSVPEINDAKGKWRVNAVPDGLTVDDVAQIVRRISSRAFPSVPLLNGFCTLIRRSALDEVGYLDEIAFPVGYGEENDLCIRIGKAGHDLVVADHVYVYHVKSASFGLAKRDHFAKAGTQSFQAKHPDVDLREVQQRLAESGALNKLRVDLRASIETLSFQPKESARP